MSITKEQLSRLEQMIVPGQQTFDLSPNDVAAIRAAVETIKTFDDEMIDYFAGQALAGIAVQSPIHRAMDPYLAANNAYSMAQAMMIKKEELKKGE